MKAVVIVDDRDSHGYSCDCGTCGSNGVSWGASVYLVPDELELGTEEALDAAIGGEAVNRFYAPHEEQAQEAAEAWAIEMGYAVHPDEY